MQIQEKMKPTTDQGEGLMLSGEIPVSICREVAMPDEYRLSGINRKNEILLKAGLMLSEHSDVEEHHELGHYLQKQDIKLNLILELIGDLMRSQVEFPALRNICVTPSGLTLFGDQEDFAEDGGESLACFHIHLLVELPKALVFYGRQTSHEGDECRFEFLGMSQQVVDLLEKVLFRHHRRKIALQKTDHSPG